MIIHKSFRQFLKINFSTTDLSFNALFFLWQGLVVTSFEHHSSIQPTMCQVSEIWSSNLFWVASKGKGFEKS